MKYLMERLNEEARGAFINGLTFIGSDATRTDENITDVLENFMDNDTSTICKTLDWRDEEDVHESIESNMKDKSFLQMLHRNDRNGLIAEVHYPKHYDFTFKEDHEGNLKSSGSCTYSDWNCRLSWVYADSMGELIDKIIKKSDEFYNEQKDKEFKEALDKQDKEPG